METSTQKRHIGFHPCVGKKATGENRPTTVVIRTADGKHEAHDFVEQQLLDFFTCGAALVWRYATLHDLTVERPPHHLRWEDEEEKEYKHATKEEREKLFFVVTKKKTGDIIGYRRAEVAATLVTMNPKTDTVGVANGGLGYQVMDVLLGRYPDMDMRVVGSGTLKVNREKLDELLPTAVRKKAISMREQASDEAPESGVGVTGNEDLEEDHEEVSKSAAKDANAKFDAHRIAYALADLEASKLFHVCTLRDRDWAGVNIAYGSLEASRKARVATEQQFRQTHRTELRRLVKDSRVPHVTLTTVDKGDEKQSIEALLAAYERTLLISTPRKQVKDKMEILRHAYTRIEGAREHEERMEGHLESSLKALPEYSELLFSLKEAKHAESGMPMGKYIGERIFGRWIAGFGSPMATRIHEPMRPSDVERIAACRAALTEAIAKVDHTDIPVQPEPGGGKTREWLLACERVLTAKIEAADADMKPLLTEQLQGVTSARAAYRALQNAKLCAKNRPLNRVIAFMGLHVKQGGKYADVKPELSFPRRRKGGRANWNEQLLRQGAYQWATLIIKGGDSHWKANVYLPYKERLVAQGMKKGHAHKRATWRMTTVAMRWLVNQWFDWEKSRALSSPASKSKAA